MRFFGGKRAAGARRSGAARPIVTSRSPDAALGRETRGLVGGGRGGRTAATPVGTGRRTGIDGDRRGGRRSGGGGRRQLPGLPHLGLRRTGLPHLGRGCIRLPRVGRIVTPARAGGLLGMLAAGFLYSFVSGPAAFALTTTDLPELRWTEPAIVTETLALREGDNVFHLDTAPMEQALEALPAIADAEVRVALPEASVVVTIHEREAILAWEAGDMRYLADRTGVLFTAVPTDAVLPTGVGVVEDRRLDAAGRFAVGDRLDPVDLDVATRLGSLTPADVGSAASRLGVRITEGDGFVVLVDRGWMAVFGFYSPATRPTDMIPGQVRLLRSLLAGREDAVQKVILASETDGTYVPKSTPKPSRK